MKMVLAVGAVIVAAACFQRSVSYAADENYSVLEIGTPPEQYSNVSILQLIVVPKDFQERVVGVVGDLFIPEREVAFLVPDTDGLGDSSNRIYVDVPPEVRSKRELISGNAVTLVGTFSCHIADNGDVIHRQISIDWLMLHKRVKEAPSGEPTEE